ncbi:MAG: cyanophycin synthetase [bacterium]
MTDSQNNTTEYEQYSLKPGPLQVQGIKIMRGANYFSGGRVIVVRLALGEYDEVFTNAIPGFYERLQKTLPSLIEHHCSPGKRGGFFQRVQEGTLLGHVTEHTAIELQTLAGMDVSYGKTRMTATQGLYNVVFRYLDEIAGVYAGKAALNLVNSILLGKEFDVATVVQNLIEIRERRLLGPSTQAIVAEAQGRGIPFLRLDEYNLVQLGTGKHQKRIRATITSDTNLIAVETADDRLLSSALLKDAGIPVPEIIVAEQVEPIIEFQQTLGCPLTIKPFKSCQGRGINLAASGEANIRSAFEYSRQHGERIMAQRYLSGNTYRLLIVDNCCAAVAQLIPPMIRGDGKATIAELLQRLNRDPLRDVGDKSKLTLVEFDEITKRILTERGYRAETILPEGEELPLKVSGSMRSGGSSRDVTDDVHPMNRFLAERAAKVVGLNIAGVDIVTPNISASILDKGGAVIEVNAAPDFRMHLNPTLGVPRDVTRNVLDMLFPGGSKARIPIFSVTGSSGKTLTVSLLHHCLTLAGYICGTTTSNGLYIGDHRLKAGDMTFPEHAELTLKDPTINCAILETSVQGILYGGLGYEYADYGIVLNVQADETGVISGEDMSRAEDLAYAKSVVVEQVYKEGYSILNADDPQVLEMQARIDSNVLLFSHDYNNAAIRDHVSQGGAATVLDGQCIVLLRSSDRIELIHGNDLSPNWSEFPKPVGAAFLAAAGALCALGLDFDTLRESFKSFSAQQVL